MPKIVDHDERRRELATAAMQVAIEHGIEAVTVRSVAAAANCSTGALAHYFETKDDLLIGVQRSADTASRARIEKCFADFDGRELLEELILSVLPMDEARRGEWQLWLAYFARAARNVRLARAQQEFYQSWHAELRRAFRIACGPNAKLTRSELDVATDAAMTLIQGLGVLAMYEPSGVGNARQRRLVREHLDRWLPSS